MNFLRILFFLGLLVGLVVTTIRLTMVRWWKIPTDNALLSASLAPSLNRGDWVLLWRGSEPGFADLVLCEHPEIEGEVAMGRILGTPGDIIEVRAGTVTLNGKQGYSRASCPGEKKTTLINPETDQLVEAHCQVEEFAGYWYPTVTLHSASFHTASFPTSPTVVGEGEYFLISDNRVFPYDSRHFGLIPAANCRERIFFRLWSAQGFSDAKRRFSYIR